jgi:nucleoid DNA-binding protein
MDLISKTQLIRNISAAAGLTKENSSRILQRILSIMATTMLYSDRIEHNRMGVDFLRMFYK